MSAHNDLGKNGEQLAAAFLMQKGYTILHQNWRYKYYEIDIIAQKDGRLHFIEVKTRKSNVFGYPEESVTKRKFKFLQKAADEFLQQNKNYKWIRYDVLSVTLSAGKTPEFFLIEDVFL